ncbi:MAG TPA: hypothetical protein VE222_13300, partial [Nitrospiraceae bacterium]|nr:hypothetical protein [Nitrospiraceae bacterium]
MDNRRTAREFLLVVGLVSFGCMLVSIYIPEAHIFLKLLFAHLAAIGFTGAIATLFFAYHDVKESISSGLATLVIDGRVVTHLSRGLRKRLRRRTLLADLGSQVTRLPDALASLTENVALAVFASPHIYNYDVTITVTDVPGDARRLEVEALYRFVVNTRHLEN